MQRYDSYKDSGIQWLGEIPSHWEVIKLKYTSDNIFTGCSPEYSLNENEHLIIGQRNNQLYHIDFSGIKYATDRFYSSRSESEFLRYGDVLLNTLGGGSVGRAGYFDYCGAKKILTDSHLMVIRPKNYNNKYLSYFLISRRRFLELLASGSTNQSFFNVSDIKILKVPKPSIEEQNRIVQYLDTATAKIDEAIAQQQKMIDLLNERKQIIINNAVTKGLNPNAKMKPSGIDWIGNIPEHWEVLRIRYIGEAKNGLTYSPNNMVDEGNGILVLRSSNIQDGKLAFNDNVYVKDAPEKLWIKKRDIIICSRNGSAALVGKCAIVEEDMHATFGAFMMRFRSEHESKYIYYLLTAAIGQYKQLFSTSTINQLTLGIFADIKMPFVSDKDEQKMIANSLDCSIEKVDNAIANATKQIALLQERKQIIINEVVTGKVKIV